MSHARLRWNIRGRPAGGPSPGAALVVLDQVEKAAAVHVLQSELNDLYGLLHKL